MATILLTHLSYLIWFGFTLGIVSEHASDVTSSVVRVGAVNAITHLLDAPQSHAVLREVLPSMGNLIHDKVEKVRLAVVRMLLRIKTVPNIKYYHIVPLEHLTARFAAEAKHHSPTNAVSVALTSLMVNSYFPEGSNTDVESSKEPIRRALQFCTDEPEAAIVFYTNVAKFRSFHSIAQLTIHLLRCLHTSVQEQMKQSSNKVSAAASKRRRRFGTVVEDRIDDGEGEMTPPLEVMATIAEIICILWQSIESQLQDYEDWNQFLLDEFSGPKLSTILTFYESKSRNISTLEGIDDDEMELMQDDCHRICSSMLQCAARLPSKSVDGLVTYMVSSLTNMAASQGQGGMDNNIVTSYIALFCMWGLTDAVVLSFMESIRDALGDSPEGSIIGSPVPVALDSKKRRSSGRNSTMKTNQADEDKLATIPQLPVEIVLSVLDHILIGSDASSIAARKAILASKRSCENLIDALQNGMKCMERILNGRFLMVRLPLLVWFFVLFGEG
jgi:condensin-2 complex subunit G2